MSMMRPTEDAALRLAVSNQASNGQAN